MAGTIAATIGRATSLTRRLTRIERDFARKVPLPETFPFRLEQVVPGQAAREAQEARVGDHPMRRTQASAAHRPASLQQLVYLQHPEADRKSTRLNSSHQIISYAVFCLKK